MKAQLIILLVLMRVRLLWCCGKVRIAPVDIMREVFVRWIAWRHLQIVRDKMNLYLQMIRLLGHPRLLKQLLGYSQIKFLHMFVEVFSWNFPEATMPVHHITWQPLNLR